MRRFINKSGNYGIQFSVGEIYNEHYIQRSTGKSVLELVGLYPKDWQEVFEEEEANKPLHKDTDLGYYAGIALSSLIELYDHRLAPSRYAKEAIEIAKEMIKQLDEETK